MEKLIIVVIVVVVVAALAECCDSSYSRTAYDGCYVGSTVSITTTQGPWGNEISTTCTFTKSEEKEN